VPLLVFLLASPFFLNTQTVHAQQEPTLADIINNVLLNIRETNSSWNVIYGQVFGLENRSVFVEAISQALGQNDYQDVIFIARLAELNNYSSQTINSTVEAALQNMPMAGSLPATFNNAFLTDDRYMINAYRYAQELGVPGWNITQAFLDFAGAYLYLIQHNSDGEIQSINPSTNSVDSFKGRYYDEYAQTLDTFLEFALNGETVNITYSGASLNAASFMDDMWLRTQCLWNGQYYKYTEIYEQEVECEMMNFAQIVSEYQNYRGDLPWYERVIEDLE
jgi:hypothetical protein